MSSKASGARRVTLTSQPKGAVARTRWSPPRTKPATNGAQSSAGRIWSMCRRWADDVGVAPRGGLSSSLRSYATAPSAALQPKRKSCDRGVVPGTLLAFS